MKGCVPEIETSTALEPGSARDPAVLATTSELIGLPMSHFGCSRVTLLGLSVVALGALGTAIRGALRTAARGFVSTRLSSTQRRATLP
jgi:hypothetical protein